MFTRALLGLCVTLLASRKVACRSAGPPLAPLYAANSPDRVMDEYIIMFKEDYALHEHWLAIEMNLTTLPQFSHFEELGGYTVEMNESTLNAVRKDPNVEFVEAERLSSMQRDDEQTFLRDHRNNSVLDLSQAQASTHYKTSTDPYAPYNLQMIGAATKLPTPVGDGNGPYEFIENAGQGVDIYIMDDGVKLDHRFF